MNSKKDDYKMSIKNIGKNLKFFRRISGLSQEQVATCSKISLSFYKNLESANDSAPSLSTLISICTVLKVPIDFILKDCGERLFSDYVNSVIVKQIQQQDEFCNSIYSDVLLSLYENLHVKGDTQIN